MTTHKFVGRTLFIMVCACSSNSTLGNGEETGGGLTEETLRAICAEFVACPSPDAPAQSQAECEASVRAGRDQAVAEGCGGQWDAVLACGLQNWGSCEEEGYVLSPACNAQETAFEECRLDGEPDACAGGGRSLGPPGSPVECTIACEKYSADCTGIPEEGPITCLCRTGPGTGTMFEIDNCDSEQLFTRSKEACM